MPRVVQPPSKHTTEGSFLPGQEMDLRLKPKVSKAILQNLSHFVDLQILRQNGSKISGSVTVLQTAIDINLP